MPYYGDIYFPDIPGGSSSSWNAPAQNSTPAPTPPRSIPYVSSAASGYQPSGGTTTYQPTGGASYQYTPAPTPPRSIPYVSSAASGYQPSGGTTTYQPTGGASYQYTPYTPPAQNYTPYTPPAQSYYTPPAQNYTPAPAYTPPAQSYYTPPAQNYTPAPAQSYGGYTPPPVDNSYVAPGSYDRLTPYQAQGRYGPEAPSYGAQAPLWTPMPPPQERSAGGVYIPGQNYLNLDPFAGQSQSYTSAGFFPAPKPPGSYSPGMLEHVLQGSPDFATPASPWGGGPAASATPSPTVAASAFLTSTLKLPKMAEGMEMIAGVNPLTGEVEYTPGLPYSGPPKAKTTWGPAAGDWISDKLSFLDTALVSAQQLASPAVQGLIWGLEKLATPLREITLPFLAQNRLVNVLPADIKSSTLAADRSVQIDAELQKLGDQWLASGEEMAPEEVARADALWVEKGELEALRRRILAKSVFGSPVTPPTTRAPDVYDPETGTLSIGALSAAVDSDSPLYPMAQSMVAEDQILQELQAGNISAVEAFKRALPAAWGSATGAAEADVAAVAAYQEITPRIVQFTDMLFVDPVTWADPFLDKAFMAAMKAKAARATRPVGDVVAELAKDAERAQTTYGKLAPWLDTAATINKRVVGVSRDGFNFSAQNFPDAILENAAKFMADPDSVAAVTGGWSSTYQGKITAEVLRRATDGDVNWIDNMMTQYRGARTAAERAGVEADVLEKIAGAVDTMVPVPKTGPVKSLSNKLNSWANTWYLGRNTGYAVRNGVDAVGTGLIDNLMPFYRTAESNNFLTDYGRMPAAASQGMGSAGGAYQAGPKAAPDLGAVREFKDVPKSVVPRLLGADLGVDRAGRPVKQTVGGTVKDFVTPTLRLSEATEQTFSSNKVATSLQQQWPSYWRPLVDDAQSALTKAGVPPAAAEFFAREARGALNPEQLRAAAEKTLTSSSLMDTIPREVADALDYAVPGIGGEISRIAGAAPANEWGVPAAHGVIPGGFGTLPETPPVSSSGAAAAAAGAAPVPPVAVAAPPSVPPAKSGWGGTVPEKAVPGSKWDPVNARWIPPAGAAPRPTGGAAPLGPDDIGTSSGRLESLRNIERTPAAGASDVLRTAPPVPGAAPDVAGFRAAAAAPASPAAAGGPAAPAAAAAGPMQRVAGLFADAADMPIAMGVASQELDRIAEMVLPPSAAGRAAQLREVQAVEDTFRGVQSRILEKSFAEVSEFPRPARRSAWDKVFGEYTYTDGQFTQKAMLFEDTVGKELGLTDAQVQARAALRDDGMRRVGDLNAKRLDAFDKLDSGVYAPYSEERDAFFTQWKAEHETLKAAAKKTYDDLSRLHMADIDALVAADAPAVARAAAAVAGAVPETTARVPSPGPVETAPPLSRPGSAGAGTEIPLRPSQEWLDAEFPNKPGDQLLKMGGAEREVVVNPRSSRFLEGLNDYGRAVDFYDKQAAKWAADPDVAQVVAGLRSRLNEDMLEWTGLVKADQRAQQFGLWVVSDAKDAARVGETLDMALMRGTVGDAASKSDILTRADAVPGVKRSPVSAPGARTGATIPKSDVETFAERLMRGEDLSAAEDLQFFENNSAEVNAYLRLQFEMAEAAGKVPPGSAAASGLDFTGPVKPSPGALGVVSQPFDPFAASAQTAKNLKKALGDLLSPRQIEEGFALDAAQAAALVDYVDGPMTASMIKAKQANNNLAEMRRNFALLNYADRSNFTEQMTTIFPWFTWPSKAIPNWGLRMLRDPWVAASLARVRAMTEEANQEYYTAMTGQPGETMPDWWKYQIQFPAKTGPQMFEWERIWNPMSVVTGGGYAPSARGAAPGGQVYNFLDSHGLSVHPLLAFAKAAFDWSQGEKDAARQTMGYIGPNSRLIKSSTAWLAEKGVPGFGKVPPGGWAPEMPIRDFMGPVLPNTIEGGDINEQNGIAYVLRQMYLNKEITPRQYQDTAGMRSGEIWDIAKQRQAVSKAGPNLMGQISWGLKGRSSSEFENSVAWGQWMELSGKVGSMPWSEWNRQAEAFDREHPGFAEYRMARQQDPMERFEDYTKIILDRLAPGEQWRNTLEDAGMLDLYNKFKSSKAAKDYDDPLANWASADWSPDEAQQFMEGMYSIAGQFDVPTPDQGTAFDHARALWNGKNTVAGQIVRGLGFRVTLPELQKLEQDYFDIPESQRQAYLLAHPELKAFWDAKDEAIADGLLFKDTGTLPVEDQRSLMMQQTQAASPEDMRGTRKEFYSDPQQVEAMNLFGDDISDLEGFVMGMTKEDRKSYLAQNPAVKTVLESYWGWKKGKSPGANPPTTAGLNWQGDERASRPGLQPMSAAGMSMAPADFGVNSTRVPAPPPVPGSASGSKPSGWTDYPPGSKGSGWVDYPPRKGTVRGQSPLQQKWAEAEGIFGVDLLAAVGAYSDLSDDEKARFRAENAGLYNQFKQVWDFVYGPPSWASSGGSGGGGGSGWIDYPPRSGGSGWIDYPPRSGGSGWVDYPPRSGGGGSSGGFPPAQPGGGTGGTPGAPVEPATPEDMALISSWTGEQFAEYWTGMSEASAAFAKLAETMFGPEMYQTALAWFNMTPEERAAYQAANPGEWDKLLGFLTWFLRAWQASPFNAEKVLESIPPGSPLPPVLPVYVPMAPPVPAS